MFSRACFPRVQCAARRHFSGCTAPAQWPSVAIIGIGQMGAAVAGNLLRNGVELTLFDLAGAANVPPPLEHELREAAWANTAKDAVSRADVVITALPSW